MNIHLHTPITAEDIQKLHCGDSVTLTGVIYTARDAAHARLVAALREGKELPVDLRGQTVFYAGPTPPPPDKPVGSIGPTTSCRMDSFTPELLQYGVRALIGKGQRNDEVKRAIAQTGSVYFAAIGGCAAYMAACVESCEVLVYEDLGTESIKRLVVRDLPLTVAVDCHGGDAYEQGRSAYLSQAEKEFA